MLSSERTKCKWSSQKGTSADIGDWNMLRLQFKQRDSVWLWERKTSAAINRKRAITFAGSWVHLQRWLWRLKETVETWISTCVRMLASADVNQNFRWLGAKFYYAWNPGKKSILESYCNYCCKQFKFSSQMKYRNFPVCGASLKISLPGKNA